jgi:aminoglycoside phosphotransferase (APT) family kinase protein
VALCNDPQVMGAPFYLMGFVDGVVLDRPELIGRVPPAGALAACEQLVDTLVALHAVEPGRVGLADFGRPAGFLQRQLGRWHKQWLASQTRPLGQLDAVVERLAATLPEQTGAAIVHGDYRLTNVMYRLGSDGGLDGIAAVVDWEMATLGDPLTDVGLLVVYQTLATEGDFVMPRMDPTGGWPSAGELVDRYANTSGRDLGALPWYVAFGYFKLAVVAEGIHHRYLQGQTVGAGFEHFGAAVPTLLDSALRALDER